MYCSVSEDLFLQTSDIKGYSVQKGKDSSLYRGFTSEDVKKLNHSENLENSQENVLDGIYFK